VNALDRSTLKGDARTLAAGSSNLQHPAAVMFLCGGLRLFGALLLVSACCARPAPSSPQVDADRCLQGDEIVEVARQVEVTMTDDAARKLGGPWLPLIYMDLQRQREAAEKGAPPPPLLSREGCLPRVLDVTVYHTGALDEIQGLAPAGRPFLDSASPSTGWRMATGRIRIEDLGRLAAIPGVTGIAETWADTEVLLNYSVPEIGARALHAENPSVNGTGVTIVVIDTGIEYRHGAFRDASGETRLRWIWDLTLTPEGAETPGPGGLGVRYSRPWINDALHGRARIRHPIHTDLSPSHGTLVAGVAAGDGSPATCSISTCCRGGGTYVGVSPGADLVDVRVANVGSVANVLPLLQTEPDLAGRPLVVNISLATNRGPHDGTDQIDERLDDFVASGPGRVVVVGAGNSAARAGHAMTTVAARTGSVDGVANLEFRIQRGETTSPIIGVWPGKTVGLQIVAPSGATTPVLPPGDTARVATVDGVNIAITPAPPGTSGRYVHLERPGAGRTEDTTWTLRASNPGATAVPVHCWVGMGDAEARGGLTFLEPGVSTASTITTPSTARQAIGVAAYNQRASFWDFFWSGSIASYSGRGPVPGDPADNPKPTISAPGESITTPKYDASNLRGEWCDCCPDWCIELYVDGTGTSIAAPHVTGAIALMLQVNPALTRDQIVSYLEETAADTPAPIDPNVWGAGKLRIAAAIARVREDMGAPAAIAGPGVDGTAVEEPIAPLHALLRARARGLPNGDTVVAIVSRHFSETRRLINSSPRIATMWHRATGPLLLRRLVAGAIDAAAPSPIEDARQRAYLQRFFEQLRRYGSARLRSAIDAHALSVIAILEKPLAAQVVGATVPG